MFALNLIGALTITVYNTKHPETRNYIYKQIVLSKFHIHSSKSFFYIKTKHSFESAFSANVYGPPLAGLNF